MSKTALLASRVLKNTHTAFSGSSKVQRQKIETLKCINMCSLPRVSNNFITVIKSQEFCTSGAAFGRLTSFIKNRKRRNNELKEADLKVLSEYKKQADDQEFHFHTRQKQLEEKTKALILSKSDANTQGNLLQNNAKVAFQPFPTLRSICG